MRLFLLHLRRGLHPGLGVVFALVAFTVFYGTDLPATVAIGAQEPANVVRGLRRADLLLAMLSLLLPLSVLQAAQIWRRWESRERAWILSSPASKWKIVVCGWAGTLASSWLWLLLIAGLCEGLASESSLQEWRAAGELSMRDAERSGPQGKLTWCCELPAHENEQLVRFTVGVFGSANEIEELRLSTYTGTDRLLFDSNQAEPARITAIEVRVPAKSTSADFELHAVGATSSLLLNQPELELLLPTQPSVPTGLLLLRAALLLAVAQAWTLGLCAWFTPGTALGYIFGLYLLVWLEAERWSQSAWSHWLPGDDLPHALGWIAQGRGPDLLGPPTWLGTVLLVSLGLSSAVLSLRRWRVGH